ncbi:poly-gamma-glutamate synthase PgsB/CapB [Anaerovirgula multivorans]|uniref:Poly-gamma-glutamate synthase PgsB/CapB n=1 Tax=Anaerovirgula multivorans TaxID=312168 RepID=A0A239FLJ8_9FIRM|nr:poly-gamma-glutamate synthase PgsB [Anaerovirgula multivorans]SNS57102.1 poly-gamma-glutamate synthase PgsB/CapB [Anaerovirgula multivorans]
MGVVIFLLLVVLLLGIIERVNHNKNLSKINTRVNVNGTRGKSTVTRLITGVLKEAGIKVVGKTTGTSARIIYWDKDEEKPITRGPLGPNIIEQKSVVREAAKLEAEAFVTECMAVNPDYQIAFQKSLVKANIGVIVNVREDHLDLCGPTLDFIAESFTSTIPQDGYLIITDSEYNDFFTKIAEKRNCKTIIADESKIPDGYLDKFGYIIFPENVSIPLAVAEALNIDRDIALKGMLKANPDPGALRIYTIGEENKGYFVNGFAANDPNSTLFIWNHIQSIGYPTDKNLILLNCRPDRVDRTIQFAEDVLPHMDIDILAVMGESTKPITEALNKKKISARQYMNLEGLSPIEIFQEIEKYFSNRVVYGVGNIHGGGDEIVELIIEDSVILYKSA